MSYPEQPRSDVQQVEQAATGEFPPHAEPLPVVVKATPPALASPTFGTMQATTNADGTPKLLVPAHPERVKVILRNPGAASVWIGPSEALSTGTGFELQAAAMVTIDTRGDVWGVSVAAANGVRIDSISTYS